MLTHKYNCENTERDPSYDPPQSIVHGEPLLFGMQAKNRLISKIFMQLHDLGFSLSCSTKSFVKASSKGPGQRDRQKVGFPTKAELKMNDTPGDQVFRFSDGDQFCWHEVVSL